MDNAHEFVARMGFFLLIPLLFIAVGIGMFFSIMWGLISGGPRARTQPGAPYLYDRFYYLLWLVAAIGWAASLLAFIAEGSSGIEPWGFLLGWAIGAVGMGSLFLLRGDMMIKGARYLADNGFLLSRWYNRMQLRQLDRQNGLVRKLLPIVFLIAGSVALVASVLHGNEALAEIKAGAATILRLAANP